MIKLEDLTLDHSKVSDLTALQDLINIKTLNLECSPGKISWWLCDTISHFDDISPLSGLTKLEKLDLSSSRITNIDALHNLNELKWLSLLHTNIKDITSLSKLTKIESLNLGETSIDSVHEIGELHKLSDLNISFTEVDDLSPLSDSDHLIRIKMHGLEVKTLRPIIQLKGLRQVDVDFSGITKDLSDEFNSKRYELNLDPVRFVFND